MKSHLSTEGDIEVNHMVHLKKSQSLEGRMNRRGKVFSRVDPEDEIYQGSTGDDSHDMNSRTVLDILDHSVPMKEQFDMKNLEIALLSQCHEVLIAEPFKGNWVMEHSESISSFGDSKQLERSHEDFASQLSGENGTDSGQDTPTALPIAKSLSLPYMGVCTPHSGEDFSSPVYFEFSCRHDDDLGGQKAKSLEFLNENIGSYLLLNQETDNSFSETEKDKCENLSSDDNHSFIFTGPDKDWTTNEKDGVDMAKRPHGDCSVQKLNGFPSKDLKMKRIEDWISMIDVHDSISFEETSEPHSNPFQEISEPAHSTYELKNFSPGSDTKINPGMEAAKSCISSMTATSTSAQLANLGLVTTPFLSAFVGLRVLNFEGNAIVRIIAGALPRGLHVLNLSKNSISTIEGLRELSRLRVLNLSHNRISRIGHGLGYCSSLKELYLSGNKISEVEGLHRLLKLNILDLRCNKISTVKCLNQLVANYGSLQVISLEGNPAQTNLGDEQLKKHLKFLLPNLVYLNRQPTKANSSKELPDRLVHSALPLHKYDGGLRSELMQMGKTRHRVASHKPPSSSNHNSTSRRARSPSQSKSRHRHLPPIGAKDTIDPDHHDHLTMRLKNFHSGLSMHRSLSVGNVGAQ